MLLTSEPVSDQVQEPGPNVLGRSWKPEEDKLSMKGKRLTNPISNCAASVIADIPSNDVRSLCAKRGALDHECSKLPLGLKSLRTAAHFAHLLGKESCPIALFLEGLDRGRANAVKIVSQLEAFLGAVRGRHDHP